ncbi:MAG: winged helix DNA-binding protein [Bacteroidetes bacterium]|nr:winged helix DNA-binding protein [Bacteroidota bacterium]
MSLEEEIHQKSFKSEYHKLAVNILYTHGWLVSHIAEALRPFDITVQQYNVLRILRGQYPAPATITMLRERMLDKMSDASRLIERLRSKGLIDRRTSETDRRKVGVVITEKGLKLLTRINDLEDMNTSLFSGISEHEARSINDALDTIRGK